MLDDILRRDPEDPVGLVLTDIVWNILEDHLSLLATQDQATVCEALEHRLILASLIRHLLPLELIALTCWVDCHEPPCVLDACTKTLKLDDLELGVHRRHILLLALSEGARRQLKVNHWPLSHSIAADLERLALWIEVEEVGRNHTREVGFNLCRSELDEEVVIAAWSDGALLWEDAVGTSVK